MSPLRVRHGPGPGHPTTWEPFVVHTLDRVAISGVLVPSEVPSDVAVVLGHGFLGSWRRPQNVELARILAREHAVFLFDFRGHGASKGRSTVGDREALDIRSVVALARSRGFDRVVTVGASMGGIAVLREAAFFGDVDAVVSISSPGRWAGHGALARLAGVLVSTRAGRSFARRAFGTDVYPEWTWSPPPSDTISDVRAPVLIVHGSDDRFIPKPQAQYLYARASHPKRLLVLDDFGHAELGYTQAFGELLLGEIDGMLDGADWGGRSTSRVPARSAT